MANLTLMEKLRRKHATPTAETLDYKPLAVIAGTAKRTQTLADSIDYILRHNYDADAYDRLRGAEYDDEGENEDEFPEIDEADFDTDQADFDAGHFDTPKRKADGHSTQEKDAPRNNEPSGVGETLFEGGENA